MKFTKLRIVGFKSFVDAGEFVIEPGLTGVVGPNGCGKSNLVEALRWVMGESSYKNMRASGMDDVIFSGSATRPARNTAEVTLFLDNSGRTAPPAFNDADELQVSRRIEREAGSVYRINGKEARARDVQLLFADQSTGARSPSMVGQGRIGELIQAKPQARRALLEEAAGISGLHSRRHEAELRLRAAEQNLERLDDVVRELETQIENLRRQARQATRFKNLSAEIRKAEAILLHLRWSHAKEQEAEAASALSQAMSLVAGRANAQMEAAKEQAIAVRRLPELREAEASAAGTLQRLNIARGQVEEDARRVRERLVELHKRVEQFDNDIAREEKLVGDNAEVLARLEAEEAALHEAEAGSDSRDTELGAMVEKVDAELVKKEAALAALTARKAEAAALRGQAQRAVREGVERRDRLARQLEAAEKAGGELASRRAALEESRRRLAEEHNDAVNAVGEAEAALVAAPEIAALEGQLSALSAEVAAARARAAEVRAAHEGLKREALVRRQRLTAISEERKSWKLRAENADRHIASLAERRAEAAAELEKLNDAPEQIEAQVRALLGQIAQAETLRKEASERLQEAENKQRELDKRATDAVQELATARESRVRAEERQVAAEERRKEVEARIQEALNIPPHLVIRHTGLAPDDPLPDMGEVERRLERLKIERERLGAVNLRAEEEQNELAGRLDTIISEREDIIEAIRKLRQAIQNLNREGRERLLSAFEVVNGHFKRLFTHLFGGGAADLQLIESEDPLEAGLEIVARPPGKRPQTMTLLSGGEQALTATALIFAVFLTNPAPICVLDEVDAPLDDHNVERFCNLMEEMANSTETRFIIITHNPITMARMNRLFGVTMAEQGVSQLVSVDLETAERIREAS
ncbi:AAA family ATPase [Chelativorans sp. Marseille-P2723]|uniref:chromosome segregation SMC family protein n=1 Tax=Chelativorans sp. Marseille-P2723 TaxID=2709133 RepID=UPI00156F5EE3|nr:AAA family ATPase [Chelativorans sp. Marseille-P2723]